LIGHASVDRIGFEPEKHVRGVFDKEARRKPLTVAADAVISHSAVWGLNGVSVLICGRREAVERFYTASRCRDEALSCGNG
jgi:hypothetical protein